MLQALKSSRLVWLAGGVVVGLLLAGLWPQTPLHAVATDRIDTFAMATGPLDEEIEAVYFLDFLTGELRAAALGRQTGKFMAFFKYNVLADFGVDPAKNPKFLMVTGVADFRKGAAHMQPSKSVVYVAEVTTGKVGAYSVPWSPGMRAAGVVIRQPLVPLDMTRFREIATAPAATP